MIYFLIPVYNEALNLPLLAENLKKILPDEKKYFVFSDDGSADDSIKIIHELFPADDHIVLGDGCNYGPGKAFNSGFEWILSHSTDVNDLIVSLEADNTSDPEILPQMVAISRMGYQLVLSSVYAQGGGFDKTSLFRKSISFIANLMLRFLFDIKVLTLSSFYRVYHVSLVRNIKSTYSTIINEKGFISMIEILLKAIRIKATIIEVPMTLRSTKRIGKSKMKLFKTMMSYLRFVLNKKF